MAENLTVTPGSGATVAADDISGVKYQQTKLVDGTADSTDAVATDIGTKTNALRVAPASDITDGTYIGDVKFGESLPAGTNAIGKLSANSGVDIGDVDVTSLPDVTQSTQSNLKNEPAGNVAHDTADSGNPIKVGGKAKNQDGTAPGTAVTEDDRADFITDVYGRQFVEISHPNLWDASDNQSVRKKDPNIAWDYAMKGI